MSRDRTHHCPRAFPGRSWLAWGFHLGAREGNRVSYTLPTPPEGIRQSLETFFCCHICWLEARKADKHPTAHRIASPLPPQPRIIQPQISMVLKSRNPALEWIWANGLARTGPTPKAKSKEFSKLWAFSRGTFFTFMWLNHKFKVDGVSY